MKRIILFCLMSISIISFAKADKRSYVWTYEYMTLAKGEKEIEHYLTLSSPKLNKMSGNTKSEHQLEFEMGMTDHFDIGIYQVFSQSAIGGISYDEFKLRARYRIGEKNSFFVDPLIYLEYIGKPDFSQSAIELKLILAKDFGKFNISFNPYIEYEKESEGYELVPSYALGLNYSISDLLRFGFEFKGNEDANYFGPVLSHGSESAYFCIGSGFAFGKISEDKQEIYIRMILGINL